MPFVQFIPETESKNIHVSLTPKGVLSLNQAALTTLGLEQASHVFLFFDPERRALGLRAADPALPGAVPLFRRKRVASVRVGALLTYYRLVVSGKLLLEPEKDEKENLIVLPLLGARMRPGRRPTRPQAVRAPRAPRPGATKQPSTPTAPAAVPPRKRGRPRKAEQLTPASAAAPRKRGRPRKTEASAPAPTPTRRRERPRKTQSSAP